MTKASKPIATSFRKKAILIIVGLLIVLLISPSQIVSYEISNASEGRTLEGEFRLSKVELASGYPKAFFDLAFIDGRYFFLPHARLAIKKGDLIQVYRTKDNDLQICAGGTCVFPVKSCGLSANGNPIQCKDNALNTFSTWFERRVRPYVPLFWI